MRLSTVGYTLFRMVERISRRSDGPLPAHPAPADLEIVRRSQTPQWVAAALLLVLAASIVSAVVQDSKIDWTAVGDYLLAGKILNGFVNTLLLTVLCMGIGILLGLVAAVMTLSENPVLRFLAGTYIWLFRGVPALVQLIFWFNLALIFPRVSVGIPFVGVTFLEGNANELITPFVSALLGLGLAEGAYMSEIIRGGILAVDKGQSEAGLSLGMTRGRLLRRIVLPQAMRVIIPPTGNEVISMLKLTSLVAVVSGSDLLSNAQGIYTTTYEVVELLIVVSVWYLIASTALTLVQRRVERRYGRGFQPRSVRRRDRARGPRGTIATEEAPA